ncbi:hypothetical protein AHiyo6_17080 [Arthrobacter sp. Hiyo6]|nr:hypothetical protein AHiyo6_17080 [Arthrobacter sp. Hiyo6]
MILLVRAFSRSRSATSPERPRNSKLWGSLAICWASSESGAASWRVKFDGAAPVRSIERFIIMFSRTLRDHPYWLAAAAYQFRSSAVAALSRIVRMWPHGKCATTCGTFWSAPQARTIAVIYCRFRADRPFMSGNDDRRSLASRLMTPLPHPWLSWRVRMSLPRDQ